MKRKFSGYPICEVVDEVREALAKNSIVILQAPPGAGKSTVLPLELLNEEFLSSGKIIMLEPRRLAARSVAERMSHLLNEETGETIGFRIRFEKKISSKTKLEVVTEGILTRMLQNDNALENYGLVIFDEFHERSLHADLSLALCLQAQQILRPDLKILIMSATLDCEYLSSLLHDAPIITSDGRQFPVDVIYTKENSDEVIPVQMARGIKTALREKEGDILAFFPGAGEIIRTQQLLEDSGVTEKVLPLYGDLNYAKQQEAILPDKNGKRKIILSTSIAETSLTIEGISIVIDCGFSRGPKFDPRSGLTRLETFRVSKDTADQRAGRAGRLSSGTCYRLWTTGTQQQLQDHRSPEILEADLSSFMLELLNWGINSIKELNLISLPPAAHVSQAMDLLESLNAVLNGRITHTGKELLSFPAHPRIAHMFLEAKKWDDGKDNKFRLLAADIASLLDERDPLEKLAGCDIQFRLDALKKFREKNYAAGDKRILERIERLADSWRRLVQLKWSENVRGDYDAGKLIAAAYPERAAKQTEKNKPFYKLANGKIVRLPDGDSLITEEWLAVSSLDAGAATGKIFLAAALDPSAVKHLVKKRIRIYWDERAGKIVGQQEEGIGQIVFSSKPIEKIPDDEKSKIICEAVRKEGLEKFGWNEDCEQWQARVLSLRKWNPEGNWPDVSEQKLLEHIDEWLPPYLINIYSRDEMKRMNWQSIANSILTWEQQQLADELAPVKIQVPSGSAIKLVYFPEGKAPELQVRLQEVFGMKETPAINNGQVKIVLHLLSPGFKPVQVTQDLHSFWDNVYHEVRKELQRRYPKHSWPENPHEAQAIRGPRRKT